MPPRSKTNKKTVSAKKPSPSNQLTAGDVESIINAALLPALAIKSASSPTKRKALVLSDSEFSGIEVIEPPSPSPKKARPSTPPPGTSAFNKLPAVSFSDNMGDKLVSASASLEFGSTRSSRVRTKSAKAVLLEEEKVKKLSQKTKTRSGKKSVAAIGDLPHGISNEDMDVFTKSPIPVLMQAPSPSDDQVIPDLSEVLNGVRSSSPDYFASDDELPEVSDLALVTPKKRQQFNYELDGISDKRLMPAAFIDREAVEVGDRSTYSDNVSDRYLDTDDDGSVGFAPDDENDGIVDSPGGRPSDISPESSGSVGNHPDDPDAVTAVKYQDPHPSLRVLYQRLPYLSRLREIKPYNNAITSSPRLEISKTMKRLNTSEADSLIRSISFVQSGFFVNFSTIDPCLLQQESGKIRMAYPGGPLAVGIYTGLCTQGLIFNTGRSGPPTSQYDVHGLTVAGSDQDTRRYMSLIGTVLDYEFITGHISDMGLSFFTRGPGKGGNSGNSYYGAPVSPSTPSRAISSLLRSVAVSSSNVSPRGYPAVRNFEDRIPVYDGRESKGRKFSFTDADFKDLSTWPLYCRGRVEIEEGTIVSVGHTIGTYTGTQGGRFLSTNVHFVIVLGKPAKILSQYE